MADPYVGKLAFFRVLRYIGIRFLRFQPTKVKKNVSAVFFKCTLTLVKKSTWFTLATSLQLVGLKDTTTGDTLCDEKNPVILESMEFPEPVISVAVEPKTKADQEKMGTALARLAEEDPTFKVRT